MWVIQDQSGKLFNGYIDNERKIQFSEITEDMNVQAEIFFDYGVACIIRKKIGGDTFVESIESVKNNLHKYFQKKG